MTRRLRLVALALPALALLVLPAPAAAQQGNAPRDRWFGGDKVKHFFLSAFTQSVAYSAVRATGTGHQSSLVAASATTAAVGIAKEWRDRGTTGFSARDLVWDAAGAGAATLLLRRTQRGG